ncbi:hypothetical protein JWG39_13335 [Desulforhopalus vacuolatus]|uniref:hypothetical protein n=1 Tax=Desulforhopalus vacuolatus TaxID=40414 RepID=UPI0019662205|nr:hypothetical protein [Desulforhopalus vacuolatus]MBM9520800.1 hypothetical protein [Desulforhopalus vacuolatus]
MLLFRFFTSLHLSVVLFLLLVVDLLFGWYCLEGNTSFYQMMNRTGLVEWLLTFGRSDPFHTSWFVVLLVLLFFLAINTLCCTGEKLTRLAKNFHATLQRKSGRFTLSVHLMHLAMVVLLAGYLLSYIFGEVNSSVAVGDSGMTTVVPGTQLRLRVEKMEMIPYSGKGIPAFEGRRIDAEALLHISLKGYGEKVQKISMNRPVFFHGWSLFMQTFNPKSEGSMSKNIYIVLDVRRDPGIPLTFCGMTAFVLGVLGYLCFRPRKTGTNENSIPLHHKK